MKRRSPPFSQQESKRKRRCPAKSANNEMLCWAREYGQQQCLKGKTHSRRGKPTTRKPKAKITETKVFLFEPKQKADDHDTRELEKEQSSGAAAAAIVT